jgi:uncharacterized repeat protein (TIGR03803 family)
MKAQAMRGVAAASSTPPCRLRISLLAGLLTAGLAPGTPAAAATSATVTVIHDFGSNEGSNFNSLVLGQDGKLYGSATEGGLTGTLFNGPPNPSLQPGYGTLFQLATSGQLTIIYNFNFSAPTAASSIVTSILSPYTVAATGFAPGPLSNGPNGVIYGTTLGTDLNHAVYGVNLGQTINQLTLGSGLGDTIGPTLTAAGSPGGSVFMFSPLIPGLLVTRYGFSDSQLRPIDRVVAASDGNAYFLVANYIGNSVTVEKLSALGQLSTLHTFANAYAVQNLIQAGDGSLYGTTFDWEGAAGTVFRVSTAGVYTLLHTFASGDEPTGQLVQAGDGKLYGITYYGGSYGHGSVYRIDPSNGAYSLVHSFDISDGAGPVGGLTLGKDGELYGTAYGGAYYNAGYAISGGVLYQVATNGSFAKLADFGRPGSGEDCASITPMVQTGDGTLYGLGIYSACKYVLH